MSILNACATAGAVEWVKEVHRHVLEVGMELDLRVGNALVHSYTKSGIIVEVRLIFDRMGERDVITWNIMIGGLANHGREHEAFKLANHGREHEAFKLLLRMQRGGCVPNAIKYVSILKACSRAGALERVEEVHRHVLAAGRSWICVWAMHLLTSTQRGSIADALLIFDRMGARDFIIRNIMIGGLADRGRGHQGYEHFLRKQGDGFKPRK